jgi:hypothetical protein
MLRKLRWSRWSACCDGERPLVAERRASHRASRRATLLRRGDKRSKFDADVEVWTLHSVALPPLVKRFAVLLVMLVFFAHTA